MGKIELVYAKFKDQKPCTTDVQLVLIVISIESEFQPLLLRIILFNSNRLLKQWIPLCGFHLGFRYELSELILPSFFTIPRKSAVLWSVLFLFVKMKNKGFLSTIVREISSAIGRLPV